MTGGVQTKLGPVPVPPSEVDQVKLALAQPPSTKAEIVIGAPPAIAVVAEALVWSFDLAAMVFILSLWPISRDHTADDMRRHSAANDANRAMVLVITAVVLLTVMAAIASELGAAEQGDIAAMVKLVLTLAMAWFFTNLVFMLHYAHNYYRSAQDRPGDRGGFLFPETPEPDYWDFCYFSFTAGMTFQTSDVIVTRGQVRRVVMLQCLLAFVFNIGVIAFIINTLGASA